MSIENVADYLEKYNIEYRRSYGELIITCPICEKEKHCYIKDDDGCWICFRCGEVGSWSKLTQVIGGERYVPLKAHRLNEEYKPESKPSLKLAPDLATKFHSQLPERITAYLTGTERALNLETIDNFQLGWDGNSITIPIYAFNGDLVNIKHRKDPQDMGAGNKLWSEAGSTVELFNGSILQQSHEFVVLAEGEFDAMVALQHGFPAVSSTGGASTFKREWTGLFNQVKKIYVCYDTDEAGRAGAVRVASILGEKAFIVRLPSEGDTKVDLTDYFAKLQHTVSDFQVLLQTARNLPVEERLPNKFLPSTLHGFEVKKYEGSKIELVKSGITFEVRVRKKQEAVGLTLSKDGIILHQDNLKLQSHRRRKQFSSEVSDLSGEEKRTLENDLVQLGLVVNELAVTNVKSLVAEEKPLNQNEVDAARAFLKSPRLMYEILKEVRRLGVIGEERNALLIYLTLTSRITNEPLSLTVKGSSSAGKSFVITKVVLLFPLDAYKDLTDATPQSFYYLDENALAHKIVIIFEVHGSQKADYAIRSLQSEGKLKIQSTTKNEETGKFEAQEKVVNGPTGFISTTTKPNIHPENETRNFTIYPDESKKQTVRILESANNRYLGAAPASQPNPAVVNFQKLLRPYPVVIDFAKELSERFPKEKTRVRRDYSKLLSLVANITLLHQEQRQFRVINGEKWLVATLADYYIAQVLFQEILAKTIQEIHPTTEVLLEKAKVVAEAQATDSGKFTARMLTKETGWDIDTVNKWIRPAENQGFIEVVEEARGRKGAIYKLSDKELTQVIVMPKVEELYEINPDWLYGVPVYHPFTGETLNFQTISTDVPTLENLVEAL